MKRQATCFILAGLAGSVLPGLETGIYHQNFNIAKRDKLLKELRDYVNRSRREIDKMRGAPFSQKALRQSESEARP